MENYFTEKSLEIKIQETSDTLRLNWIGEADADAKDSETKLFLYRMKDHAVSKNTKLILDFSGLEYMNTSFIGMIANFVLAVSKDGGFVELILDTKVRWQEFSTRAFEKLFSRIENISIVCS